RYPRSSVSNERCSGSLLGRNCSVQSQSSSWILSVLRSCASKLVHLLRRPVVGDLVGLITQRSVVQIHPPQPTFSICCRPFRLQAPLTLRSHCQQLTHDLSVCGALLLTHSLRVHV